MEFNKTLVRKLLSDDLTEVLIRVGIITFMVIMSVRVVMPFAGIVLWGLILAVTLYPLHQRLAARIGDRQGGAATLLVLVVLLLIGIPTVMLGVSFTGHIQDVHQALQNNTIQIPPPAPSVEAWPLIGEKLYKVWGLASRDLPALLQEAQPQLEGFSRNLLAFVASSAGGILKFLGSMVIAGIMMAYGKSGAGPCCESFAACLEGKEARNCTVSRPPPSAQSRWGWSAWPLSRHCYWALALWRPVFPQPECWPYLS